MKKHEETKSNRKWVFKAMIAFIAILAVLTFFSNTIMNLTIPIVVTSTAMRGNLAYTNSATAQLVSDNQIEVKGLEGRTVAQVVCSNYDTVSEGDVIMTLVPVEDMHELTDLETQLVQLQRQQEYAQRTPHHNDFSAQNRAVRTAELALAEAQATLNSATNREETIYAAQQVLAANQAAVVALQSQVNSASLTVENLNAQIAALNARLNIIDGNVVPVPTNAPAAGVMYAPAPGKYDPEPATETETSETTVPSETTPSETTAPSETTTPPTETTAPAPEPTSAPPAPSSGTSERDSIVNQIAQLQGQLADAMNRLAGYSAQLAAAQTAVNTAQTAITTAQALPSTYAAQDAVNDAQAALTAATIALSDAQINAGIAADQAADSYEDRERQIADLEDKIERTRARLTQNEILAPADGMLYNVAAAVGDKLSETTVIFTVVPQDSTFSASFTFPTNVAQSLSVGQELNASDNYWVSRIVITNIKPDANNPRESRIVKCAVYSDYTMMPGETITVRADRGNATYDHVVAASAVSEDNSGTFVFVVDKSTGPLGDRYTVRRVSVTVQARSGAFAAISGEGLDNVMVVTRSEEPLHNGDRVRLEDYSGTQN